MARWQLTEPHYLNSPGNHWEFETKNRKTGRSERKQFPVPIHLDPNAESDWNYVDKIGNNILDGKIIVCYVDKGEDQDIVFEGAPTPGMLPIDNEAKEISSKFDWKPTAGLDENSQFNSFAQQMLIKFTEELKGVSDKGSEVKGLNEFMVTMAKMMQTQTEILAALTGKKTPEVAEPELDLTPPHLTKHETSGKLGPLSPTDANRLSAFVSEPKTSRRV